MKIDKTEKIRFYNESLLTKLNLTEDEANEIDNKIELANLIVQTNKPIIDLGVLLKKMKLNY